MAVDRLGSAVWVGAIQQASKTLLKNCQTLGKKLQKTSRDKNFLTHIVVLLYGSWLERQVCSSLAIILC